MADLNANWKRMEIGQSGPQGLWKLTRCGDHNGPSLFIYIDHHFGTKETDVVRFEEWNKGECKTWLSVER